MKIVYQGEHSGVLVAEDGSTYSCPKGVPVDVPSSAARKLCEGNPTIWRTDEGDKPAKADKADKPAPDSKESK